MISSFPLCADLNLKVSRIISGYFLFITCISCGNKKQQEAEVKLQRQFLPIISRPAIPGLLNMAILFITSTTILPVTSFHYMLMAIQHLSVPGLTE